MQYLTAFYKQNPDFFESKNVQEISGRKNLFYFGGFEFLEKNQSWKNGECRLSRLASPYITFCQPRRLSNNLSFAMNPWKPDVFCASAGSSEGFLILLRKYLMKKQLVVLRLWIIYYRLIPLMKYRSICIRSLRLRKSRWNSTTLMVPCSKIISFTASKSACISLDIASNSKRSDTISACVLFAFSARLKFAREVSATMKNPTELIFLSINAATNVWRVVSIHLS